MTDKRILCAFGVDLDAVGGWLGSYGGRTHLTIFPAACSPGKWERPGC